MDRAARSTTRDLRRGNREILLRSLAFDGPNSRQRLSELTGLSTATVSTLISAMLAEGVLAEAGLVDSDGGRPRVIVRMNPDRGHSIGVDVGETRVRVELFDSQLTALAKAEHAFAPGEHRPEPVAEAVLAGMRSLVAEAGIEESRILGIGLGVPGVVVAGEGAAAVVDAPAFGWSRVPLGALLRAGTRLPLHLDNGAKTLGLAELRFGAGRGSRHLVVVLVGSGVGAALINDGRLYRGVSNSAGEWGHTTVERDGRLCRCGRRGCLEAYVGATAVLARHPGGLGSSEESALSALVTDTGPEATALLTETVDWLGLGLANLINLLNPERVLLGGWAGRLLGSAFLPEIRAAAGRRAMPSIFADATIELGALGPDAVALGAATRVVEEYLATAAAARA
ncbi:ROK family transcriptional regulator [Actinocorallia lasiicapitis]